MPLVRAGIFLCMLLAAAPSRLPAQTALALSDLTFTTVIAGVTQTVRPSDPTAAQFQITPGKGMRTLQLVFSLPSALSGPGSMPIVFDATSGIWSRNSHISGGTTFDPRAGISVPSDGMSSLYVWIGGTVQPPPTQAGGNYTGTITITVTGA